MAAALVQLTTWTLSQKGRLISSLAENPTYTPPVNHYLWPVFELALQPGSISSHCTDTESLLRVGFQPTPERVHGQETPAFINYAIWAWRGGANGLLLSSTSLFCSEECWCFGRSASSACCRLHWFCSALTTIQILHYCKALKKLFCIT